MLKPIDPKAIDQNVFSLIGEKWMLITAGTAERCNTMTASWGGLGVIWGAPSATCYIRPQRYTKEFLDRLRAMVEARDAGVRTVVPAAPRLVESTAAGTPGPEFQDDSREPEQEQLSIRKINDDLIEKCLAKHGGKVKPAAAELGISERTIYRKLAEKKNAK